MSVAREVAVKYDMAVLEQAARDLGYIITRNAYARGWGSNLEGRCDLVITSREHRFDMGFVRQPDGSLKMVADMHGGHVQRDMAHKILPRYAERMIDRAGGRWVKQEQTRLEKLKQTVMRFVRR